MAPIMNSCNFISDNNRRRKEYQIEVITYDNESEIVYVIARTAEEAQAKALAEVLNSDYAMVQGVYEY